VAKIAVIARNWKSKNLHGDSENCQVREKPKNLSAINTDDTDRESSHKRGCRGLPLWRALFVRALFVNVWFMCLLSDI